MENEDKRGLRMRKLTIVWLVVVLAAVALIGSYLLLNVLNQGGAPRPMVYGKLSFSNPPALSQTAVLTYRMDNILMGSFENGEMVSARIVLPEGLVWVSGDENSLIWENRYLIENLRIPENKSAEISGIVKAVKIGRWTAEAFVTDLGVPLNATMKTGHPYDGGALVTLNISENSAYVENGVDWPGAPAPRSPMSVTLSLSDEPKLNQTVDLSWTISSQVDAPNTTAELTLPDGFVLASGDTRWSGNLIKNSTIGLSARIKAVKVGDWVIRASARSEISSESWFGATDQLFISMTEENATVSHFMLPPNSSGEATIQLPTLQQHTSSSENSFYHSNPGFWVKGRACYYDEIDSPRPLKWVKVQVWKGSVLGEPELLGITTTDNDGQFTFGPVEPSPLTSYWALVCAETGAAVVKEPSILGYPSARTYGFPSGSYSAPGSDVLDVGDLFPPQAYAGAWRILAYLTDAWDYLRSSPIHHELAQVRATWPSGDWPQYYPRSVLLDAWKGVIRIPGDDLADRSPDVVQHEYGHFVMNEVYGPSWDPPKGDHSMGMASSKEMAWVEGWANFFPLAVQNDPIFEYRGWYVYDLENRRWGRWPNNDDVEGNVTATLWDIVDDITDDYSYRLLPDGQISLGPNYDQISLGFKPIWDVFRGAGYRSNTFSEFWNAFKSTYAGDASRTHFSKAALFQNTIDYNLYNPTITITPISGQVTGPPIVSATPDDPDWEDRPYLWVEFEYSLDHDNWVPFGKDFVPPYKHGLGVDNCAQAWVRARAWDGMETSSWDETGPFSIVPTEAVLPAITVAPGKQSSPAVAFGDNVIFVVWNDRDMFIRGKVYDLDGNVIKPEFTIAASPKVGAPSIATDGENFFVVWQASEDRPWPESGEWYVRGVICDFSGNLVKTLVAASRGTNPSVAFGRGVFMVAWANGDIHAATFNSAGQPRSRDIPGFSRDGCGLRSRGR